MPIKNKKEYYHMPTVEEFLLYKPKRLDFEWYVNAKGFVEIKVSKFGSRLGKSFCKIIKKENIFTAHMDEIGSAVWKNCDGEHTVKQILDEIKRNFPNEKNIDQRLFLFIQQMKSLNYIDY